MYSHGGEKGAIERRRDTWDPGDGVRRRGGTHGEVAEDSPAEGGRGSEPRRRHGLPIDQVPRGGLA